MTDGIKQARGGRDVDFKHYAEQIRLVQINLPWCVNNVLLQNNNFLPFFSLKKSNCRTIFREELVPFDRSQSRDHCGGYTRKNETKLTICNINWLELFPNFIIFLVLFVYDCSHPRRRNRHQKSSDGGTYKQ
jgi:hypothetical protein